MQRACLSGSTSNRGWGRLLEQVKCMVCSWNTGIYSIFWHRQPPPILWDGSLWQRLWQTKCPFFDLRYLTPDDRWQKRSQKIIAFWLEELELKKCTKLFQNIALFYVLSSQNTANTSVFDWIAWEPEVIKVKKTPVVVLHFDWLKNTVNSGVNIANIRGFSSKGINMPLDT